MGIEPPFFAMNFSKPCRASGTSVPILFAPFRPFASIATRPMSVGGEHQCGTQSVEIESLVIFEVIARIARWAT